MKLEPKSFEEQWADAFINVSEMPPDIVWSNIEKQLEPKKQKRPFLFWLSNPKLVAGIAAMLLLSLGYLLTTNDKSKSRVITNNSSNSDLRKNSTKYPETDVRTKKLPETPINTNSTENKKEGYLRSSDIGKEITQEAKNKNKWQGQKLTIDQISLKNELKRTSELSINANQKVSDSENISKNTLVEAKFNQESIIEKIDVERKFNQSESIAISKIDRTTFKPYNNRFTFSKNKISYEMPTLLAKNEVTKRNRMWFGINSGIAPYNPNYSISAINGDAVASIERNSNEALSYKSVAGNAGIAASPDKLATNDLFAIVPQNTVKSGRALNFGFNIGKKISKKFALESGLRLSKSKVLLQSNVYSVDANSGQINSFFENNYVSNFSTDKSQTIIATDESNNQIYNYMNIPLQLNYAIVEYQKLSLDVMGGLSGDVFLNGKFEGINSDKSIVDSRNSNIRMLNVSGLGGIRINYKLKNQWLINIGSMYQRAIASSVTKNSQISFKPSLFGVTYGLSYSLK